MGPSSSLPRVAAPSGCRAHEIGRLGESIAAHYLEMCGYRILARNRHVGRLEIDLVAERSGVVAIIEVRTRTGHGHGRPEETVGWRKRRNLARAAAGLAAAMPELEGCRWRFDLVAIERRPQGLQLRHLSGLPLRPSR